MINLQRDRGSAWDSGLGHPGFLCEHTVYKLATVWVLNIYIYIYMALPVLFCMGLKFAVSFQYKRIDKECLETKFWEKYKVMRNEWAITNRNWWESNSYRKLKERRFTDQMEELLQYPL
jgi:hypothetical protein